MRPYSAVMDVAFKPSVSRTAIRGDNPSISAMASGPTSLQKRSIRRICAFMPCRYASSWFPITTTQSRSTATVLAVAHSFSMHASTDSSPRATAPSHVWDTRADSSIGQKSRHDRITAERCPMMETLMLINRSVLSMYWPMKGDRSTAANARTRA